MGAPQDVDVAADLPQTTLLSPNRSGDAAVVRFDGDEGEIVAKNSIGEPIQASPAVAGNAIFLRSDKHLWKIAS